MRCDVLLWDDVCHRGKRMIKAMMSAAPAGIRCEAKRTSNKADLLLTWGMGHAGRKPIIGAHLQRGGRVIGLDLGYWDRRGREDRDQAYRLTIDHDHPWRLVKPESAWRFEESGIVLREDADPAGPVLLAGMGRKSAALFPGWLDKAKARIETEHPGRALAVRSKDKLAEPIDRALVGKSLVVCRHSNVAIDACIAGIPVQCEDGIAYALYKDQQAPSRQQRLEFLSSVAHWQYKQSEAAVAWKFLLKVLGSM